MNAYIYIRGGSWLSDARDMRAAVRFGDSPLRRISDFGFRLVRSYE